MISHPTDSHLYIRQVEKHWYNEDIVIDEILNQGDSCSELPEDAEKIEISLTEIEHRMILALFSHLEVEARGFAPWLQLYWSNGQIEQEEIEAAEQIAFTGSIW